jgi:Gamma-glutamyl cyclotransferase, AIG2-like
MGGRRVPVFFYGLFMDPELLRARGADPVIVGKASVPHLALRIGQRAALVPNVGSAVHGVLMELSHEELERLYSEPSVQQYRPEPVLAQVEGESIPALCYNLVEPPSEQPNQQYVASLRALATRLELPVSYIESIGS